MRVGVLALIGVVAFAARLHAMLAGGGLGGISNYDDGVYFAAAESLVSGRLPYRDFVLLHPPGIVVALSPFAALAHLVSDATAFELARLVFMALGATNAVLAAAVGLRSSVAAGLVTGLLYALWPPAIYAEVTTLLTPWSTLGLLLALFLVYRRPADSRREVLAGVALGMAAGVKIWGVVPLAVVVARHVVVVGRWSAARVALGAAAALCAVCLPFFVAAPREMFRMVVLDQFERGQANASFRGRMSGILGTARFGGGFRLPTWLLAGAAVLVLVAAVVGAVADRAWLVTSLLAAVLVVLLAAPTYFGHYGAFAAGPLLVLAGSGFAATARIRARGGAGGRRRPGAGAVVAVMPAVVFATAGAALHVGTPFPGESLRTAAAPSRCVTSDSPVALIEMNVLSRDLARRCRVWVDVSGLTYDTAKVRGRNGVTLSRPHNGPWQKALLGYLTSGNATIVIRRGGDGLAPPTAQAIDNLPVIAAVDGYTLRAVHQDQS
jgi:hypothetical protein